MDIILLLSGTSFPSKNATRFAKSTMRNQVRVLPPNGILVTFLLNMLPLSSGPCNRLNLPIKTLLTMLKIPLPSTPMQAMHLEAKPTRRKLGSNDWWLRPADHWVHFTLLTAQLLCFLLFLLLPSHHYILNLLIPIANSIPMPTLVPSV